MAFYNLEGDAGIFKKESFRQSLQSPDYAPESKSLANSATARNFLPRASLCGTSQGYWKWFWLVNAFSKYRHVERIEQQKQCQGRYRKLRDFTAF